MAVYKCKICGGETTVDASSGIATCEYCGTKQALPLFTEDSERLLYERGNNYLSHSEYDKAENVFNQLLAIKPSAAELYWDLVLCKYGVTYVKDPKTGKYIPTCNRTHYTPIFSDENYKKAIELSSGEKKALFEEDAKTIDNIQKGIIAVSKKEKPFDIFISYKETDADGNRTKDSVEAQKLYEKLTEAGYKVFFSRITLEDKIGTEYEPYIYAALYSSKVMLTICSSKENIEAVWVKNEWSRFLGFRQNDNSKTLLPLYFDMDKSDLPEEFALLSAYDMKTDGFMEELLRGIKKLIPLPIMKAKQRKQMLKVVSVAAGTVCAFAVVLTAIILPGYLKDKKYQEIYLNAQTLFGNAQYEEASKEFDILGNYKDSEYMVTRCTIQPEYDVAMQLYYDAKYAQATWAFEALGDYEDSAEQKEKAELSWRKSLATVAAPNKKGAYYVSANGTISTFKNDPGQSINKIDIANHGKAVSIGGNATYTVYGDSDIEAAFWALHEDGFISNNNFEGDLKDQKDFIQISEGFDCTHIALRSNGTLVYGNLKNSDISEEWLVPVSEWENIVSFDTSVTTLDDGMMVYTAAILAVKSDGSLCIAMGSSFGSQDRSSVKDFIKTINNAKLANIYLDPSTDGVIISIITKDGKLIRWEENRDLQTHSMDNIIYVQDALFGGYNSQKLATFVLKDNGDLTMLGKEKIFLSDVVYINEEYAVTRSGSIYLYNQLYKEITEPQKTEGKTRVHDEWLGRLN